MTGLEKFAIAAVLSSTVSMTQITISNTGTLFGIGWAILGAVLATGIMYGTMRTRLGTVEKKTDNLSETCATKESVEVLTKHVETLVKMLDSRIIDRRQG